MSSCGKRERDEWDMRHIPIKLGPLAVLLTVISICMSTLGILAFATARADLRLAEEYAETVRIRYELEAEGQRFLRTAAQALREGREPGELDNAEVDEDGTVWRILENGEFRLKVGIVPEDGELRVVSWKMQKDWEPEGDMNLWQLD